MTTGTQSDTANTLERQSAHAVVMIEPARLAANPETLATNRFQTQMSVTGETAATARREFDALARALTAAGVGVRRFDGNAAEALPDEVFPNNWFSTHADGTLVTYPMAAPSRRRERRDDVLETLAGDYEISRRLDLSYYEDAGQFLEGTGSLVLDRPGRVAYAARSARTTPALAARVAAELGYRAELFTAADAEGHAVYHTNVALSLGTRFAVVASAAIGDATERRRVLETLEAGGRELIEIGFTELAAFAANLLELEGAAGPVIALSGRALESLGPGQRRQLERHGELLVADIATIERAGGGSVRCMLAEIYLPPRKEG